MWVSSVQENCIYYFVAADASRNDGKISMQNISDKHLIMSPKMHIDYLIPNLPKIERFGNLVKFCHYLQVWQKFTYYWSLDFYFQLLFNKY